MYDAKFVWLALAAGVGIGIGLGKSGNDAIVAFAAFVGVAVAFANS
jgi:hypothetical protein